MRKLLIPFSFICILTPFLVFGQSDTLTTGKKNTLTLSTLLSSNANYYGQTAAQTLPFTYIDLKFPN